VPRDSTRIKGTDRADSYAGDSDNDTKSLSALTGHC
jgi:hypothetical protein